MQAPKRKREVSSCVPCYTRKQKCDRRYPCDRCTRRRRPELCAYTSPQAHTSPLTTPLAKTRDGDDDATTNAWDRTNNESEPPGADLSCALLTPVVTPGIITPGITPGITPERRPSSSLADVFGYYGQSNFNTMALVRSMIHEDDSPDPQHLPVPSAIGTQVRKIMDMMLGRPILDFLVRYFVTKVNWIDQFVYPPWFLARYQKWWELDSYQSVADIEFPILFLRTCCYASQFLPSPACPIDSIKGVSLHTIRTSCEEVIHSLIPICTQLDPKGSLVRVLHITFGGLAAISQGRMNAFWESLSCASRVAQQISLHQDPTSGTSNLDELEKEVRRRTFCNLYIWDSCLANRLDRTPFLPDNISPGIMPQMHLTPDIHIGPDAPDLFTERVIRAQLAKFWRRNGLSKSLEYDAIAVAERYENFCKDFLPSIPSVFALQPDKQWDERIPSLPMQRQLLHMAIFEFLCWHHRPILLQKPDDLRALPGYKQILVSHNKRSLAVAALNLLQGVSDLRKMMGGSHTRFSGVIVPIFEAAVPLLCLCEDESFPGHVGGGPHMIEPDPLAIGIANLTREQCMEAARSAYASLQTLSEVSCMAEVGARTLARLILKIDSSNPGQLCGDMSVAWNVDLQAAGAWDDCAQVQECSMRSSQPDCFIGNSVSYPEGSPNWDKVLQTLSGNFPLEEIGFLDTSQF